MATIKDIQTQILTSIANAIRTKEGTTGKIPNSQLASRIENLQTGTKVEGTIDITENGTYDVSTYASANVSVASSGGGEDTLQTLISGTKSLKFVFANYPYDNIDFAKNLDTSMVITMESAFQNSKIKELPQFDASNVEKMNNAFYDCTALINVTLSNTSKVKFWTYSFSGCINLKTLSEIDMGGMTSSSYSVFNNCENLTNLTLLNIKYSLQIGNGTSWGHLLTLDSLINTCKELINVGSPRTLTMGSANLEKIAHTFVKFTDSTQTSIARNEKGDVVVCESTDAGAMLLSDYASLKNWTLA